MTLTSISDVLRDCLIHIANVSINDQQWSQATLPVKVGGLELSSPMKLALSKFLASVLSTLQLQNDLLRNCPASPDDQFKNYLFRWTTSLQPLPLLVGTVACRQRSWNAPLVESSFATLLASQFVRYSISFSTRWEQPGSITCCCCSTQLVVICTCTTDFILWTTSWRRRY